MAGIIKLTTRRLPQKVLNLGIRNVLEDIIEVRSAGTSRLICRQLITASSQKLYNDVYSNNQRQRLPNSTGYCYGIRNIHMTTRLLQSELVKVPPFADSVSEGDVKFTVKVGDTVAVDEVVMEIETDKTTVGVPAPFNGIIEEIFVKDGDTVKAGQQLFKIKKTEGGAAPPPKKTEAAAPPPAAKPAAAAPPPPPPPPPTPQPAAAAPKPPPPPPPKPTGPMHEIPVAAIRHAQGIQQPTVKSEKMIQVPTFADSVSEGDVKFTVNVGDIVKIDQVVMEIETDKTTVGVPAPFNGVILEILVKDGDTVKAGQNLFKIGEIEGDVKSQSQQLQKSQNLAKVAESVSLPSPSSLPKQDISRPPGPSSKQDKSKQPQKPPRTLEPPPKRTDGQKSQLPSPPPASKIPPAASNLHVKVPPQDYSREITGTRTEQRVKMNRMRQKIASRLKEAQNVNAMLTTFNEIDMSSIMEFRKVNQEAFQKKYGIKFGFMSIFCKASAYALQDQPVVNAVIDGTEIVYRDYVDISVAVATPKGLVVPVIRNVESMNYADIEIALAALGEKARKGAIAVEDMDGGTFTISNGGVFGSLMGTPIINPPQSAILGMHGVFDRPIAVKGQVVIRPMMYIALTYDHRLIDGREAVMFLRKIKAAVEDPRIIVAGL